MWLCRQSSGNIKVNDFDTLTHYKETRNQIGLVPQELPLMDLRVFITHVNFREALWIKRQPRSY